MPRLNARGQAAMGVGGTAVTLATIFPDRIDYRHIASPAGGAGFLTDDTVVFATAWAGGWSVHGFDSPSGLTTRLSDTPDANQVMAGGGVWAAWNLRDGVYASTGLHLPESGLGDVGPEGQIAVKVHYQSAGPWDVVERDGTRWRLTDEDAVDIQLLGAAHGDPLRDGQRAIWRVGHAPRVRNLPTPVVLEGRNWRYRAVFWHDESWIVYFNEQWGLVAHPFHELRGFALRSGDAFRHDATVVDGKLRVVWSTGPGELAGELGYADRTTTDTRTDWSGTSTPPDPVRDPVLVPQVAAWPRKLWVAPYYSHSERYGDTPLEQHVGNAIVVVPDDSDRQASLLRELDRIRPLARPMIVPGDLHVPQVNHNTTIAWIASAGTPEQLGPAVQMALEQPEKPVVAYMDTDVPERWPELRPSWVTDRVWPSVQAYRFPAEELDDFAARVERMLKRVAAYGQPLVLTPRFDDFNRHSTIERTIECMSLYDRWIREFAVVGVMPFADRRGNGIASHPELHAWARAFLMANPARPNRFDHWQPDSSDIDAVLRNKLRQTTELITLSAREKEYIIARLDGTSPLPTNWPDVSHTLQEVRGRYAASITADECVAVLNEVAWIHRASGFGLLHKPGGNHGLQPRTGTPCSVDWLVHAPSGLGGDVLVDCPNVIDGPERAPAAASWAEGKAFDVSRFIAPVEPA